MANFVAKLLMVTLVLLQIAYSQDNLRALSNAEEITDMNHMMDILSKNDKVVVDFFATWCGPCKMMAPFYDSLAASNPQIKFVKVDVDAAYDVSSYYEIEAMPTFKTIYQKQVKDTLVGGDKSRLSSMVNALKNH